MNYISEAKAFKESATTSENRLSKHGRIHSLDGLRAASILMVIVGHAAGTVGAPSIIDPLHSLGNYGVRFFFVISGFLITHLLLKELETKQSISISGFYYRRMLRIFPAYYAYILVGFLLGVSNSVDIRSGDLIHAITYTMNYHEDRGWHFNHTWSLAVEEQFYLIWPFTLMFLSTHRAYKVLIFVVFIVPVIRFVMWYEFDASPSSMTRHFQAVSDALALGCLLAFWFRKPNMMTKIKRQHRLLLWVASALLLGGSAGCYVVDQSLFYILGQSLANMGAAVVVYLCLTQKLGVIYFILNNKISVHIGAMSYSLYLWQEPFLNSYETHFLQSFPFNVVLTFIAAAVSFYCIERPMLRLKPS